MDPLTLLRDFNVSNKLHEVQVVGDNIKFGTSYVFPRTAFTAFKGARDYYQLESALFVAQQKQLSQPEFIKAAANAGLAPVPFIDRKKLSEYLEGKGDLQLDTSGVLLSRPVLVSGQEAGEPAAKKARLQDGSEAGVSDRPGQFERELRDRNTMLQAPTKQFKSVLDVAKQVSTQLSSHLRQEQLKQQQKQKEAAQAQAKQKQQAHKAAPPPPPSAPAQLAKPVGRLERDSTTDQLKAMGGEAAANISNVISIYGYAGDKDAGPSIPAPYDPNPKPPPPPSTSQPSKPSHQPSSKPAQPPQPAPGAPKPHSSSSAARHQHEKEKQHQLQKQKLKAQQQQQQQAGVKPKVPGQTAKPNPKQQVLPPEKARRPIIIVPSGMTATITMYNARTFLEEGRFEPSSVAQSQGKQKQTTELFKRTALKPPGQHAIYELTDKPPPKDSKDWERVVAVIVQGAKWQFKDWVFKGASQGDLGETFQKVAGFYIHYADEKVPELVANWNIKCLGLTRERRHMDMTVALDFYRHLDQFLYARRSNLAY